MKLKVYLAGGLHSNWQNSVITKCNGEFTFLNPRNHGLDEPDQYTSWDSFNVKRCDILFAYMEKNNPSGIGMSFEIGLAKALGKQIILVDEKSLVDDVFGRRLNIVRTASDIVFEDINKGIEFLRSLSKTE